MDKNSQYFEKFKQLNKKNNNCCKGKCALNYVSIDDSLICGKCEINKHIDFFLDSPLFYICTDCYLKLIGEEDVV